MKLTEEERDKLMAKRQVVGALSSWGELLGYLVKLVEADSEHYTNTVVRKRLKLGKKKRLQVDMQTGEINVQPVKPASSK